MRTQTRDMLCAGLEAVDQARELVWLAQAAANVPEVDDLAQEALDILCGIAARLVGMLPPRRLVDGDETDFA